MLRQGPFQRERAVHPHDVCGEEAAGVGLLDPTDALAAFHSETDLPQDVPVSPSRASRPVAVAASSAAVSMPARSNQLRLPRSWALFLLGAVAIAEAPFAAMWVHDRATTIRSTGTVYVETEPAGAEVWVNGEAAGHTPAQLSIPRGAAEIELRHAGGVRVLPLTVVPEEIVRLRLDLPSADVPDSRPVVLTR